ncbi:MAG: CoA transferase [Gammaproteobacteria bacterium]|nr:CoA transferase [Gammaproteobacteria bacterium]
MLKPYTVLDLTDERGEIGPMLLGDMGAAVIRVESPGGSPARAAGPLLDGVPDDLKSLQFLAFNRNKRSIVLDPANDADRETFHELVRRADFVFESSPALALADYGVDFEAASVLNPRIVYVRISPFGADGPHSNLLGNDLVVAAMGGPVALQGPRDRAPVRVSVPQVWRHAGAEAAAGAMVAHARMVQTGRAQYVDLSAQAVMTWTMLQAMEAHAIQGSDFERNGSVAILGAVVLDVVHECKDGYIAAIPTSGVMLGCQEAMIAEGVVDESIRDVDWQAYNQNITNPDFKPYNVADVTKICRHFFAEHTKHELLEFGLLNDATLAPVSTVPELLQLDHFDVRDYWRPLRLPTGQTVRSPGLWGRGKFVGASFSVRRDPPKLDEHGAEIRAELEDDHAAPAYPEPRGDDVLPFDGIKVADFSWVGVGPISSKYLADHGATVVRVESENRPDVLRGGGPFKDGVPGWNRSQFFGEFNTSKLGLTLDMKSSGALEIARKLIQWSDVFIESFAPGAIERMGLDYEHVRELNPGIIMVSTCLMGQTGPASKLAGYGYHAAAMSGFYEVTGWPDLPPSGPWTAYTDTIAPRFVSVLLAAALDHRRRTGEGCFVDLAQIETALHFIGPEILDYQANGQAVTRIGNRARDAAPQGCYQCAGEDRWCAIAVDTDEQWAALCNQIGKPDWASGDAYGSTAARLAAHDEIDAAIEKWTRGHDAYEVMRRLQAARVPAGVVQRSSDLLADPQFEHRGFYHYMEHGEMGRIPYAGHQYRIAGYDNRPRFPAPLLGEHSFQVLSEILGLPEEEIGLAFASGAIA